jgi:DNA repair ATPase RecN
MRVSTSSKENNPVPSVLKENSEKISSSISTLLQNTSSVQSLQKILESQKSLSTSSTTEQDNFKSSLKEKLSTKYESLKGNYLKMTEEFECEKSSLKNIENRIDSLQSLQREILAEISLKKQSNQEKSLMIRRMSQQSRETSEQLKFLREKEDLSSLFKCY